ncbi:exodeoxyribonuclease III [Polymorphobacter sp. PAMC 29334]|uniref:exodeoxyribonuclease III n=1 Tax=Polymorphobacter sp. PAMC 29334 TaxID=2862331 RepID=UPI001C76F8F5|nr:exodeoxyribonuclease III [Polymorphobacter sp. PAMC 29334]QYE33722.1 exodeoxyribonuclease III [Polymorphobacter sp. PAMC 29334]
MKIATFNINGIGARLPRLLDWLAEATPDVVCLQEIKTVDEKFPVAEIAAAGYRSLVHGQKGFNGVAILSRAEAVETKRGLDGDPADDHSRYLEAEVEGVRIASIYLPNGNPQPGPKFDYKLAWFARLSERARALSALERPVVLAGDYNVIPTAEDVFSEVAMSHDALTQPETRAAFRTLCHAGWTDAIRSVQPTGRAYTFWDYQAGAWPRDSGLRIDHLLLSPSAADRLVNAGIDRAVRGGERASDHVPAWVELRG